MNSNTSSAPRRTRQKVQSFFARRRFRNVTHPEIKLSGMYLQRYGFNINDEVEITCEFGVIQIRAVNVDSPV